MAMYFSSLPTLLNLVNEKIGSILHFGFSILDLKLGIYDRCLCNWNGVAGCTSFG
jgi:hypothetical protein